MQHPVIQFILVFAAQSHLPADAFEDSEDKAHRPIETLRGEREDTEAELRRLAVPRLSDAGPDTLRCTRFSDLEPTESVWLERRDGLAELKGVFASRSSVLTLRPRSVDVELFSRSVSLLENGGFARLPRDKTSHPGLGPTHVFIVPDPIYILIERRVGNRHLWTRIREGEAHTTQLESTCRDLFREAEFPVRIWKP